MKRKFNFLILAVVLIASFAVTGCIKPPRYDAIVTINTNELAYLVNLTGEDTATAGYSEVQKKNIPIGNYWQKLGRFEHQGTWRPNSMVIVVPQAPVRLKWDASDRTNTVRMTSIESSGFIVPMIINAFIADYNDGSKYLRSFKPESPDSKDEDVWRKLEIKQWPQYLKQAAQPLENALNTVVYTKLIEQLNQLFVKVPILNAEISSKIFIPAVYDGITAEELTRRVQEAGVVGTDGKPIKFESDLISIKAWAKDTYGISITAMAPEDGVIYDNPDVQKQIDALAAGVMKEKTLAQDQINAQAQQRVAVTNAETERRVANEKAATASTLRVLQEIENDANIAKATADAIRKGNAVAPGTLPKGLTTMTVISDRDGIDAFGFPTK
jgi:hypothetical protein